MTVRAILLVGVLLLGCAPTPPPRWAEGGAELAFHGAQWRTRERLVELSSDGRVLEDGHIVYVLDRVGRSVDSDYEPVALLFPQGELVGAGGSNLGHVGFRNAAPPGAQTAWLSVLPDGRVVYFDFDGSQHSGGRWTGCEGGAVRACTYVTHLFALRAYQREMNSRVSIGVGLGWYY